MPNVTLSTQDNAKLLQQNQYLDYLIDQSFQQVNRFFVLSFSSATVRTGYRRNILPNAEIEDYNVMING